MTNYISILNKNDIEEFIKHPIVKFQPSDNNVYIMCSIDSYGPQPEFIYDDYTFKGINSYSNCDFSAKWRKFVLSKLTFEDKLTYTEKYNKTLDEQKLTIE